MFCNSAPFNCNDRDETNCSRLLDQKEKLKIVEKYNKYMGSIDTFDKAMGKYGLFQKISKGWGRRIATDFPDVMFNNVFCLWKTHQKVFLRQNYYY